MVTKDVLSQYIDLQEESKKYSRRLKNLNRISEKLNRMGMLLTAYQVDAAALNIFVLKDSLIQSTAENGHCFIPERLLYSF